MPKWVVGIRTLIARGSLHAMTLLSLARNFTSGNVTATGSLQVGDTWGELYLQDAPFTPELAEAPQAKIGLAPGSSLKIGGGALAFNATPTANLESHLQLFWPDPKRQRDPLLDVADVMPLFDQPAPGGANLVGLMVVLNGTADFTGNVPALKTGALSTSLDLKTGGNLSYARLIVRDRATGAKDLIDDLLNGLRLPQDVANLLPTQANVPPGEAIALTYGGYLKFKSTTKWGYSLSGARNLSLAGVDSNLAYDIKIGPSLTLDVEVAGQHEYRVMADPVKTGRTLLTVHTVTDHSGGVALDIGVTASYALTGGLFDRSFYEAAGALLGLDPQSLEKAVQTVANLSTPDGLRDAAGSFLSGKVDQLINAWVDGGLQAGDLTPFVLRLTRAITVFTTLDKSVHDFLADNLNQDENALLARVGGLADAAMAALAQGNTKAQALEDLAKWLGPNVKTWAVNEAQTELNKFKDAVLAAADAGVHDLMSAFDPAELDPLLKALAAIQTPADLQKAIVTPLDAKVQALVSQLLDAPFATLASAPQVQQTLTAINKISKQIQTLASTWSDVVAKAAKGKYTADFLASYNRATSDDTLLAASFDFAQPGAKPLFEQALAGDFTALLNQDPRVVELRQGSIERKISEKSAVSIALFGDSYSNSFEVTQDSVLALDSSDSGLVMVHTNTVATDADKSTWNGKTESKVSALAFVSAAPVQKTGRALTVLGKQESLGVTFDVALSASAADLPTLNGYFQFAEQLGLIPSASALAERYAALISVNGAQATVKYAVSLSAAAIRTMLLGLGPPDIDHNGRLARRRYYGQYYTAKGSNYNNITKGYAILTDATGQEVIPLTAQIYPNENFRSVVDTLLSTENDAIAALVKFKWAALGVYLGSATAPKDFDAAMLALLECRKSVDVFLPGQNSAMFAMLDALAAYATQAQAGYRSSRFELTLTPAGTTTPINLVLATS